MTYKIIITLFLPFRITLAFTTDIKWIYINFVVYVTVHIIAKSGGSLKFWKCVFLLIILEESYGGKSKNGRESKTYSELRVKDFIFESYL